MAVTDDTTAKHNCPDCRCDAEWQLGCGCPIDAHPNDWDGWRVAHPWLVMGEKPDPNTVYIL